MSAEQTYLPRTIESVIRETSKLFKVVLLTGMRQTGKSTTLAHLAENNRARLALDNDDLLREAKQAAGIFFERHPTPLLLDEVQRAPNLFLQMKAEVDSRPDKGQIWATGSQKFALMKGVTESLVGRLIPLELMTLSIYERIGLGLQQKPYVPTVVTRELLPIPSYDEAWHTIWQGAWPEVAEASPRAREFFFRALLKTYLDQDIHRTLDIEKLSEFHTFISALASLTGQELRIGTLAQAAGVSEPTVKKWLSVAEASGIIYLLHPYLANIRKQLVKSPKVYFTDTGLAAYLCGFSSPEQLRTSREAGAFFETFALMEILKSWVHNGSRAEFFFYRDSKTREKNDLLIRADGKLHPVEFKSSDHPTPAAIKNFKVLQDLPEDIGHGAVVCLSQKSYALTNGCTVHSLWAI